MQARPRTLPLAIWIRSVAAMLVLFSIVGCFDAKSKKAPFGVANAKNANGKTNTANAGKRDSLDRAISYLMKSQGTDGGWHSPNYGALSDGAGVTCLVLYSLAHCPGEKVEEFLPQLKKAVKFLTPQIEKYGYVRNVESPDYPNYASAMLLIADSKLKLGLDESLRKKLTDFLFNSQIDSTQGYKIDQVDFGGWDLMGWAQGKRISAGTNVSVSATVLEAIGGDNKANSKARRESLGFAKKWIARCQNIDGDGGFYFHPEREHNGNKAGWNDQERKQVRSYATATCDGIRCLYSLGYDKTDSEFQKAIAWIEKELRFDQVAGFQKENSGNWDQGLRYYFYYVLAKIRPYLSQESQHKFKKEVAEILKKDQKENGSFENPVTRMREDDPIIATSFCVIALAEINK